MAFSTQKDFFYVPFMNETVDFECKRACVKLKSYDSTIDDRSWAMDETKQSKFLTDLVTCGSPVGGRVGGVGGGAASRFPGVGALSEKDGLRVGDSVLECANTTMGKLQSMLMEKQKQLELSNERLKTADEEYKRIKDIMSRKYDSSHSKDFYNKIQKLVSSGKLNKSEEQELLQIYQKVEDMNKAYEVLQAENSYIKRLLEKLSLRASLDSIKQEPEKSTDTQYLQNTVNALRKEVTVLRKFEDAKLKEKQRDSGDGDASGTRLTQRDAENLKAIIRERNTLRDKCKTFKDLEKKVQDLQRKSKAADNLSDSLSSNLDNQSKYIGNMEKEMKRMQNYYEDEMQKAKYNEELLKCQLDSLKEELMQAKYEAQKSEVLQMEVACLRNEITKRELALNDYDLQYKQLMAVISELQGSAVQNLNDTQTQTSNDFVEDLAFFASATLEEIMKELDKRKNVGGGFGGESYAEIHAYGEEERKPNISRTMSSLNSTPEECCREKERLQRMMQELKDEKDKANDCQTVCADALKRLQTLEQENTKLKSENNSFQMTVKGGTERLNDMSNKLGELNDTIGKTAEDTTAMGKNLRESLQLVKDISDMQMKNQQLTTAVNAISTKEGQQAVDDLRTQLEALRQQLREEQEKNKKCQEENNNLQKELKQRGLDIAKLTNDLQGAQGKGAVKSEGVTGKTEPGSKNESSAKSEQSSKADPGSKAGTAPNSEPISKVEPVSKASPSSKAEPTLKTEPSSKSDSTSKTNPGSKADPGVQTKPGSPGSKADPDVQTKPGSTSEPGSKKGPDSQRDPGKATTKSDPHSDPLSQPSAGVADTEFPMPTSGAGTPGTAAVDGSSKSHAGNRPGAYGSGKSNNDSLSTAARAGTGGAEARNRAGSPGTGGHRGIKSKGSNRGTIGSEVFDPYQDFVDKNAANMNTNLMAGNCLEKELRKILEAFIRECGFCFCHCKEPKSKFYAICYKVLHQGIQTVSFRELIYIHKKVFIAADKLHPGCLLNIILSEHTGTDGDRLKCCSCKNILCCDNSEEMLREKVYKLEHDIEMARQYLETFKTVPTQPNFNEKTYRSDDNDGSFYTKTYRENNPQTPRCSNKQLKQLKARILKCSEFLR